MKNEFHHIESYKYQNENGIGLISIKHFGLGDYLLTDKPIAINWYDCHGSAGKYVCLLKHIVGLNGEKVISGVRDVLNSGEETSINDFINETNSFIRIFPKCNLQLTIYDPKVYPEEHSDFHLKFREWDFVFPECVDKENENLIEGQFLKYFEESVLKSGRATGDIVDFSTSGYYGGYTDYFVATQPESSLNQNRIEHYENLIKMGKRPYCLIFNTTANDKDNNYLVDGHHKLQAYKNLKTEPRIIEVSQIVDEHYLYDWDSQCEELFNSLYEWQSKHIFDESFKDEKLVNKIIGNPQNPFNRFIKQGYHEELWINGNIKSKANYTNNIEDGLVEYFYESGRPKSIVFFDSGKQIRNIKAWYDSGEILLNFKEVNKQKDGIVERFHRNGQLESTDVFENGIPADGTSSIAFNQNGQKTYEAIYLNGQTINRKHFDSNGKIIKEYNR